MKISEAVDYLRCCRGTRVPSTKRSSAPTPAGSALWAAERDDRHRLPHSDRRAGIPILTNPVDPRESHELRRPDQLFGLAGQEGSGHRRHPRNRYDDRSADCCKPGLADVVISLAKPTGDEAVRNHRPELVCAVLPT